MAKTSGQKEALVGIRSDITLLAGELLKDGNISPQFLAAHIVDVANNIAKQGGPMSEFEHSLWMQKLGTNLVRVFEHNYKDKLDWTALIEGDLVPLGKAIN